MHTSDYPYRTITQATTTCQAAVISSNGEQHEHVLYNCKKDKEVRG